MRNYPISLATMAAVKYKNVFEITLTIQDVIYHVIGNPGNERVKARIEGDPCWREYGSTYFDSEKLDELLDEDNYIPLF